MPLGVNLYDEKRLQGRNVANANAVNIVSPGIVEGGLVLHLDAGNRVSYPTSGTRWYDLTDNRNNGTLTNGPAFSLSGGGGIDFDGTNDYVDLGAWSNMGISNRTYMFWFRAETIDTGARRILTFVKDETVTDEPAFTAAVTTRNSELKFDLGIGGDPYNGYINTSVAINEWVCGAASIIDKTITGYKNAQLINTATSTGQVATNATGYVGRYSSYYGQYFDGQIALVLYYNRALTPTEVAQNFNATRARFGV